MKDYKKKYKEALEKAKNWYVDAQIDFKKSLETLFPELVESEDEKIRKQIVNAIHDYAKRLEEKIPTEWLAWLKKQSEQEKDILEDVILDGNEDGLIAETIRYKNEKQSEQNPTDNVELKFKVGDWVVDKNGTIQQILSYKDGIYKHTNGYSSKMFEDEWRLWDITKDAKDGDVLATNDGNICIFDGTVKDGKYPFAYCGFTKHRFEFYDRRLPFTNNNIYPATKEQYDTLMKAMSNAGYTFDFEKKELKKIINENQIKKNLQDNSFRRMFEQKPTDNVKPKFNIGDWITNGIDVDKIIGIDLEDENYLFKNSRKSDISLVDSNSHNWTIQDAKDGDILAVEDKNFITPFIAIYKERGLDFFNSHCFIGFDGNFYKGEEGHDIENIHPATKEQCVLLFQKMHEAGYEWDDKNKELKKIYPETLEKAIDLYYYSYGNGKGEFEHLSLEKFKDIVYTFVSDYGQKPIEWSEEDDSRYSSCLYMVERETSLYNWLKSLKDRVLLQPKQKWSEEDDNDAWMNDIISKVENNLQLNKAEIDWLKFIKDQVQPQLKHECNEEDEQHINSLLKRLDGLCKDKFERTRFAISEDIDWLKSIKKRLGGK